MSDLDRGSLADHRDVIRRLVAEFEERYHGYIRPSTRQVLADAHRLLETEPVHPVFCFSCGSMWRSDVKPIHEPDCPTLESPSEGEQA